MSDENCSPRRFVRQQSANGVRLVFEAWPAAIRAGRAKAGPVQCRKIGARKRITELLSENCGRRGRAVNVNDVPIGSGLFQFVAA